jgi:hypothetical protein
LFSLEALRPALYNERNARALIEGAIPGRLDRGKMDEYVFPVLSLDKSVSFAGVKPLHRASFFHVSVNFSF